MANVLVVEVGMPKVVHCTDGQHDIQPELAVSRDAWEQTTLKTSRLGPAIIMTLPQTCNTVVRWYDDADDPIDQAENLGYLFTRWIMVPGILFSWRYDTVYA
jgi:hypothetical protein